MLTRAHSDFLTDEQRMIRDTARDFARAELAPHAGQWEQEGWIPDAVVAHLGELGLLGMLVPEEWGHGYATEAGLAVAHYALLEHHAEEVFAVVRPGNERAAAAARRMGMDWAGETEKYYQLSLEVYRLRAADLDHPFPSPRFRTDH